MTSDHQNPRGSFVAATGAPCSARLGWLPDLQNLVALGRAEAEELQHSAPRQRAETARVDEWVDEGLVEMVD